MHDYFGLGSFLSLAVWKEMWLIIILMKEICKNFILVRLGTVIPSLASLPGLPTRVSLISDSSPVYTGQRGLEREWLCMDKISYLWEGADCDRGLGNLKISVLSASAVTWPPASALSSSFVKCPRRGVRNLPHLHYMLFRVFPTPACSKLDVCVFLRREPLLQFWLNNPIWRIRLSAARCSSAPRPHDEPDLHPLH